MILNEGTWCNVLQLCAKIVLKQKKKERNLKEGEGTKNESVSMFKKIVALCANRMVNGECANGHKLREACSQQTLIAFR